MAGFKEIYNKDDMTKTLQVMEYEHHEIHAGSHFMIENFDTLDNNEELLYVITTPDTTKWAHINYKVKAQSETEFFAYEGVEFTSGSVMNAINNNRNSNNVSILDIKLNPVVSNSGSLLFAETDGNAGTTPSKADNDGSAERIHELILKQGTSYLLKIVSKDDDNKVSYRANWYEHTNK